MKGFVALLVRTLGVTIVAFAILGVMLAASAIASPAMALAVLFAPAAMLATALVAIVVPVLVAQLGWTLRPRGAGVVLLAIAAIAAGAGAAWFAATEVGPAISDAPWGPDAALLWTGPAAFAACGAAILIRPRRSRASASSGSSRQQRRSDRT